MTLVNIPQHEQNRQRTQAMCDITCASVEVQQDTDTLTVQLLPTFTLSHPLSVSLSPSVSISFSLSLCPTHTHSHKHTHIYSINILDCKATGQFDLATGISCDRYTLGKSICRCQQIKTRKSHDVKREWHLAYRRP